MVTIAATTYTQWCARAWPIGWRSGWAHGLRGACNVVPTPALLVGETASERSQGPGEGLVLIASPVPLTRLAHFVRSTLLPEFVAPRATTPPAASSPPPASMP